MSGREVTARVTLARDQGACTPADLDAVRFEVVRADVLVQVAQEHFDRTNWHEVDDARIDFVAHLVAATAEAVSAALLGPGRPPPRRGEALRRAARRDLERRVRTAMKKPRRPRASKSRPDFDPGIAIRGLYEALVAAEALAVTADEAATMLPPHPSSAAHRRILARLYTLVHQTSDQVGEALEKSEEALAQMTLARGSKGAR